MTAMVQNGQGPPPLPDGTAQIDPAMVTNSLLNAVHQCSIAAAAASGQDADSYLTAALKGAQAVVILDPTLAQGGTPLQHDAMLEAQRGQTQENIARINGQTQVQVAHVSGEHALEQAKQRAAAPTPSKRKNVTVRRDSSGGLSGSIEEN